MNDIDRQKQLETDAIRAGALRWVRTIDYQLATDRKPVRDLVGNSLRLLADAIHAEQHALKSSRGAKLPKYGVPLLSLGHQELALITLGTLFNAISRSEFEEYVPPRITPVAYEIGQRCRLERIFDRLRDREVHIADELRYRNRSGHAERRAGELAEKLDDDDDWAKSYRSYHLGEKLISLAVRNAQVDGQPIFELKKEQESYGPGTKKMQRIALTEGAQDWIAEQTPEALALFSPIYVPMIVPPKAWKSLSEGGYLATPMRLLKRQTGKRAQRHLEKADFSAVFSAVNALQDTAYRINKDVDRIMRDAWDAKLPFFGKEAGKGLMAFRRSQSAQLLGEPKFYFPHQLDHRGRAYPVPQLMNPQSDHIGRSLIEFAEGKPLGERGAYWLAIHTANCYWKGNKVSFEKRFAWVQQNEKEIIDFADNPLRDHRFWNEADKPWMFLAACIEWKHHREQGPEYCSHLPVSMDGTCNGYQHLSAMGRDPVGGQATNLVPGDEPADVYQQVADQVERRMRRDAENSEGVNAGLARQLLGKIDRDLAKHPTMTTPYGITRGTIYEVLLESDIIKGCKDPKKCALYLARVFEECVREVAVEAGRIMKWLRDIANALGKKNRGMVWTTPVGFRVVHESREPKALRIATADRTILVYQEDEKQKIAARKQVDGIVAHLVHSKDAAHMMRTTNRLRAEGIHHFAMVHDSFGVHAADIDLLNRVLREEFVRIYSEPVLQNFLDEQRKAHPDIALPEPPQTGSLDIREVLSSPYFFA
jgi:DNA-directed RNA polymerase